MICLTCSPFSILCMSVVYYNEFETRAVVGLHALSYFSPCLSQLFWSGRFNTLNAEMMVVRHWITYCNVCLPLLPETCSGVLAFNVFVWMPVVLRDCVLDYRLHYSSYS